MRGWSYLLLAGAWLTQHALTVKPAQAAPKKRVNRKLVASAGQTSRHASRVRVKFERRQWRQTRSPKGERLAQVQRTDTGERVTVDGTVLYPQRGRTRVVSNLAWSRDGTGIAFVERSATGRLRLVVFPLLEMDEPLTWDLPDGVLTRAPQTTWVSPQRVGVGNSAVAPQIIARFSIERRARPR